MKKERKDLDITLLKTPERNTRIHPEKQIQEIRRALRKWGQYKNVVVDEKNVILAGNGLVKAMLAEGFTTVDAVVITGLGKNEKNKLMMADNKTTGLGIDNLNNIEHLIQELTGDFDIPGFDDDILKSINAASEEISQALNDYGKATEENLERIEAHAGVNETTEKPENTDMTGPGRKSAICPECGAVVWL
jgi:SAM-dependent MidA family methyltransferase